MHKYYFALLIFLIAAVLTLITILTIVEEPQYLTEDEVISELSL